MPRRFNPPPNWPQPPKGWQPSEGWEPDPSWPDPPNGWQLWVDAPRRSRRAVLTIAAILGVVLVFTVGIGTGGAVAGSAAPAVTHTAEITTTRTVRATATVTTTKTATVTATKTATRTKTVRAKPARSAQATRTASRIQRGVHPGAFCSPRGAIGYTVKGTRMTCTTKPDDPYARWRSD